MIQSSIVKPVPEYYDGMWRDGYTPAQIFDSASRRLINYAEAQKAQENQAKREADIRAQAKKEAVAEYEKQLDKELEKKLDEAMKKIMKRLTN